jgi:GNAT superfamily N-acetyltransferase
MTATFVPVRLPPERLVEAAAVMGRAAIDDPIFVYALPDAAQRAAGVPRRLATVLRIGLTHGAVWVTPPPIAGVACWISPAHPTVTAADRDTAGWREVGAAWGAEAFARYQAFAADVGGVFAPLTAEPHWYLAWLCVEPSHHGRGIGSALVRHVTARADAERISCQLFTSAPRNVRTYEHLGFRILQETVLPRSGLRIWVMARRPGADDADGGWRTTRGVAPSP